MVAPDKIDVGQSEDWRRFEGLLQPEGEFEGRNGDWMLVVAVGLVRQ